MNKLASKNVPFISFLQKSMLVILRIVIGWHFLYEGIAKIYTPDWTSAGYLEISRCFSLDYRQSHGVKSR